MFEKNDNDSNMFDDTNDYWSQGVMPMNDLWRDTWDNDSDYYHSPDTDAVSDLLQ